MSENYKENLQYLVMGICIGIGLGYFIAMGVVVYYG